MDRHHPHVGRRRIGDASAARRVARNRPSAACWPADTHRPARRAAAGGSGRGGRNARPAAAPRRKRPGHSRRRAAAAAAAGASRSAARGRRVIGQFQRRRQRRMGQMKPRHLSPGMIGQLATATGSPRRPANRSADCPLLRSPAHCAGAADRSSGDRLVRPHEHADRALRRIGDMPRDRARRQTRTDCVALVFVFARRPERTPAAHSPAVRSSRSCAAETASARPRRRRRSLSRFGCFVRLLKHLVDRVDHRLRRAVAGGERLAVEVGQLIVQGVEDFRHAAAPAVDRLLRVADAEERRPVLPCNRSAPGAAARATGRGRCPGIRRAAGAGWRRPGETQGDRDRLRQLAASASRCVTSSKRKARCSCLQRGVFSGKCSSSS